MKAIQIQKHSGTRVGRWTEEEHEVFVRGMELYPKEWKKIAEMVQTRTVVQIRTHAQKCWNDSPKNATSHSPRNIIGQKPLSWKRPQSAAVTPLTPKKRKSRAKGVRNLNTAHANQPEFVQTVNPTVSPTVGALVSPDMPTNTNVTEQSIPLLQMSKDKANPKSTGPSIQQFGTSPTSVLPGPANPFFQRSATIPSASGVVKLRLELPQGVIKPAECSLMAPQTKKISPSLNSTISIPVPISIPINTCHDNQSSSSFLQNDPAAYSDLPVVFAEEAERDIANTSIHHQHPVHHPQPVRPLSYRMLLPAKKIDPLLLAKSSPSESEIVSMLSSKPEFDMGEEAFLQEDVLEAPGHLAVDAL